MYFRFLYYYCVLLEVIFLLNQLSIFVEDIVKSECLLNYFVYMFFCLYGERYMIINMYLLFYFFDMVCKIGLLWVILYFLFEFVNGEFLKLFYGIQFIVIQIINVVYVFQMLLFLLNLIIFYLLRVNELVSLLFRKKIFKMLYFYFCGKGYEKEICEKEI